MPNPTKQSLFTFLINNYNTFGLRGLTAGLQLKCMQVIIGWGINDLVLKDVMAKDKKDKVTSHNYSQTLFKPKPNSPTTTPHEKEQTLKAQLRQANP